MTVHEAKEFLIELERRLVDEAIDIFAEENEELFCKFFEVINFALGNLVSDIEDSKDKCKTDCPFFTSEHRELCKEFCSHQNCYQCIIKDYEIMKQNYDNLFRHSNEYYFKWQKAKDENIRLKAELYDFYT